MRLAAANYAMNAGNDAISTPVLHHDYILLCGGSARMIATGATDMSAVTTIATAATWMSAAVVATGRSNTTADTSMTTTGEVWRVAWGCLAKGVGWVVFSCPMLTIGYRLRLAGTLGTIATMMMRAGATGAVANAMSLLAPGMSLDKSPIIVVVSLHILPSLHQSIPPNLLCLTRPNRVRYRNGDSMSPDARDRDEGYASKTPLRGRDGYYLRQQLR